MSEIQSLPWLTAFEDSLCFQSSSAAVYTVQTAQVELYDLDLCALTEAPPVFSSSPGISLLHLIQQSRFEVSAVLCLLSFSQALLPLLETRRGTSLFPIGLGIHDLLRLPAPERAQRTRLTNAPLLQLRHRCGRTLLIRQATQPVQDGEECSAGILSPMRVTAGEKECASRRGLEGGGEESVVDCSLVWVDGEGI